MAVDDGAMSVDGLIWGTYRHGLFANDDFRWRWLRDLGSGESGHADHRVAEHRDYDRIADALEEAVGWAAVRDFLFAPG